ncbi:MAG: TIGR04282 family arsenosugar biosynthesis glycosyltransferase [Bryobacteraceae bacterium]
MPPCVIVFAKAPIPGRVKTRLIPLLGAERAALLHQAFVRDALDLLRSLPAEIELHTDVPSDAWRDAGVSSKLQIPGDLGARMVSALTGALAAGHPVACILGADIPALTRGHVTDLFSRTEDLALGPAEDGGYWGIAARRVGPDMFRGVAWSSAEACRQTLEAAERCGLTTCLGTLCWDVDEPSDLKRLRTLVDLPRYTKAWVEGFAE